MHTSGAQPRWKKIPSRTERRLTTSALTQHRLLTGGRCDVRSILDGWSPVGVHDRSFEARLSRPLLSERLNRVRPGAVSVETDATATAAMRSTEPSILARIHSGDAGGRMDGVSCA